MDTFALFTKEAWKKMVLKFIEYGGEISIKQKNLQEKHYVEKQILLTELSIILQSLKK